MEVINNTDSSFEVITLSNGQARFQVLVFIPVLRLMCLTVPFYCGLTSDQDQLKFLLFNIP